MESYSINVNYSVPIFIFLRWADDGKQINEQLCELWQQQELNQTEMMPYYGRKYN